jgi:integrase
MNNPYVFSIRNQDNNPTSFVISWINPYGLKFFDGMEYMRQKTEEHGFSIKKAEATGQILNGFMNFLLEKGLAKEHLSPSLDLRETIADFIISGQKFELQLGHPSFQVLTSALRKNEVISDFYRFLIRKGRYHDKHPLSDNSKTRPSTYLKGKPLLSDSEFLEISDAIKKMLLHFSDTASLITKFLINGTRLGEVLSLRIGNVRERQINGLGAKVYSWKISREVFITWDDKIQEQLKTYCETERRKNVKQARVLAELDDADFVFLNKDGTQYTEEAYQIEWKKVCQKIGFHFPYYKLRHYGTINIIRSGFLKEK